MSGYTPLFDSLTKGTLCGRWPDIGLWPIVLSMGDRYGIVDATPTHIAAITGLPIDDVIGCMRRFCEPDPYSRSKAEDGARLALLDDHRDWGWRIVNHAAYTEKARLIHKNAKDVEEGKEAERKRFARAKRPPVSAGVRRSPPVSDPSSSSSSLIRSKRATKSPLEKKSGDNSDALRQKVAAVARQKGFPA